MISSSQEFEGCHNLEKVTIPRGIERLPKQAFYDCYGLKEVLFEDGSSLKYIGHRTFSNTCNLKTISLPQSLQGIDSYSFYDSGVEEVFFKGGGRKLRIENMAFYKSNLKTINIPEDVYISSNAFTVTGCFDDSIFVPSVTTRDCNLYIVRVHKNTYWSTGNTYHNDIEISFKVAPGHSPQNPLIGIYPP